MSAKPNQQYTNTTLNDQIKQAFSLTEVELEANRSGQMVESQQMRVENRWTDKVVTLCIGGSMMIVFACSSLSGSGASMKGIGAAVLCGAIILAPLSLLMLANMKQDIKVKQVLSLHGPVKLRKDWNGKKTEYHVMLEGKNFEVTKQIYEGFVDEETYILYYTPISQVLVGAEHSSEPIPAIPPSPPETSNPLTTPSPQN